MDLKEYTRTYTIMKDYIGIYRNTSMNIYTYEKIYIAYIYDASSPQPVDKC